MACVSYGLFSPEPFLGAWSRSALMSTVELAGRPYYGGSSEHLQPYPAAVNLFLAVAYARTTRAQEARDLRVTHNTSESEVYRKARQRWPRYEP